jgi:hypothetical protein
VGVRVDQVPIAPHMVLSALEAAAKGKEPRFGPKRFPEIEFGAPLQVPTPAEGGDGKATNIEEAGVRKGIGTMVERKDALKGGK